MKVLINTTTFPASPDDPVPAFVLDQIREIYAVDNSLEFDVLVPHNAYHEPVPDFREYESHKETRYHYFFPRNAEKLAGRGILPALKEKPLRLALIPFFLLSQFRALDRMCKETKPDLVYAHWFMTPGIVSYFVCKRHGLPLMFTTHASDMSVLKNIPFARNLITRVMTYATCYTAVSNRTANKMKAYFSKQEWAQAYGQKLSIVPMGTDLSIRPVSKDKQKNLLLNSGIDLSRKYILCMGRMSEKKGFKYLIDAYALLNQQLRDECQLVIAGDGQLMADLKSKAGNAVETGNVIFTGYVSGDLKDTLITNAALFVLPSIIDDSGDSEGLPVAMMEALAKGRIVVATDVSGAEEVLTKDAGILVNQKSPVELKDALTTLMDLPEQKKLEMQSRAKELASKFGWRSIAKQHLELMKRAVLDK